MTNIQNFKMVAEILKSAEKGESKTISATRLKNIGNNMISGNNPSLPTPDYADPENPTNEEKALQALRTIYALCVQQVRLGAAYNKQVDMHTEDNEAGDAAVAEFDGD